MTSYNLDTFVVPASAADKKIQIKDKRGVIRYTLSAHQVVATFQSGNLVKIRTGGNDFMIQLDFSTPTIALEALQLLQAEIDKVRLTTPVSIDKDISNYIDSRIEGTNFFVYHQISSSDTWLANHNMGFKPNITVTDDSFYQIEGLVKHIDNDNVQIQFNQSITGWIIAS